MSDSSLSDGALSILVFAAYHSLVSGEQVRQVVLDDGKGHRADAEGVRELEKGGYLTAEGQWATFTEKGESTLDNVLSVLRSKALRAD